MPVASVKACTVRLKKEDKATMKKRFFFTIKHRSTGGGPEVDAHKTEVLAGR